MSDNFRHYFLAIEDFERLFDYPQQTHGFDLHIPRRKFPPGSKRVEVRTDPKISRNAPCPCGSRIKAKKCCLK